MVDNPPLPQLIDAALAGGYAGLTLWPAAYHPACPAGPSAAALPALRDGLADSGLVAWDVDAAVVWAGPGDPGPPYFEEAPERCVFELAEAIGARGVNVLLVAAPETADDDLTAAFAGVCDRAAEHGLQVHLEFSRARKPHAVTGAARLVAAAGRANGGLMLDAWHLHWGAGSVAELAQLPGSLVTGVQLCDAPAQEPVDFAHATRHERLVPGRGTADPGRLLAELRRIGCRAPVTLEAFDSARVAHIGARAFACELADATRALLPASDGAGELLA